MSKASKLNRSNNIDYIKQISKDYYSLNYTGGFTSSGTPTATNRTKNLVYIKTSGANSSNAVTNYVASYKCDEIITGSIRRNEASGTTNPDDAYIQLKVGKYYNIRVDVFDHSYNISTPGHNRFVFLQGDAIGGEDNGDSSTLPSNYTIAAYQDNDAGTMDAELSTVIKAEGNGKLYILTRNILNQEYLTNNVVVSIEIKEL